MKSVVYILLLFCGAFHTEAQEPFSYSVNRNISQPEIFAEGIISTGDYDTHPAFTPGGDTLYFVKCIYDLSTSAICVSYFRNNQWSNPVVASFSGQYMDTDPFVTKDGSTIYFISDRPLNKGDSLKKDTDIWKVVMTENGWSEPVHLDAPINSEEDEYYPTLADNGNIYFGSVRKVGFGSSDIYKCKYENGNFLPAENLGDSINTIYNDYEPFISADENFLIFMATIPQGLRNADFYMSYYTNGEWSRAEKLPDPINSNAIEFSPKITRDGKYFFFSSTRSVQPKIFSFPENILQLQKRLNSAGNSLGDIYQIDVSELKLKRINHKTKAH